MSVDVVVVGAGLLGSAAARHLAVRGLSVALVGPAFGDTSRVFSSHHDQGRICRTIDRVPTWTALNVPSLAGIEALEAEVGWSVRDPVGCLVASNDPDHGWFEAAPELEIDAAVAEVWPYALPGAVRFGLEGPPAGILRVPELLRAQHQAFAAAGGLRHPTTLAERASSPDGHVLTLADGTVLRAPRVVLAPGVYVNEWLDEPLDVVLETETTLLVPVERPLGPMPALLWDGEGPGWRGPYVVPPLTFEDGRAYLKLGCDLDTDQRFRDAADVDRWFRSGDSEGQRPALLDAARAVLPALDTERAVTRPCILARTPNAHPMIGEVAPGLFVGAGAHGWGAMASDGIGDVIARTVTGEPWPDGITPDICAPARRQA